MSVRMQQIFFKSFFFEEYITPQGCGFKSSLLIRKKKITRAHSTVEHNHEIVGIPITHPNKNKIQFKLSFGKILAIYMNFCS